MNETPNANRYTSATIAMAIVTILAWVMQEYGGVTPPAAVIAGASVLIGAFVQAIYSLFPGFKP